MILLPMVRRNGSVDLLIVLDEQNIERIMQYDPAEVIWPQMPHEYSARRPNCIAITFATAAELAEIERMSLKDPEWKAKALSLLSRGFKFQSDKGDHDFGVTVLGKPTEGTKQ